jgi:hypothetical protein
MTGRHGDARCPQEDEALSGGEAVVHDWLLEDGVAWRRSVPANDRLNATVRALPGEAPPRPRKQMPREPRVQTRTAPTREVTDEMLLRPTKRTAIIAAAVAAALVVGLFGTVLYTRAGESPSRPAGRATVTAAPTATAQPTTTVIAGPMARYVQGATTAKAVDRRYVPVDVTSHFRAGDTVYVVVFVRGLPKDQKHTFTIQWYLGSVRLELPSTASTSVVVDGSKKADQNVAFGLNYPTPGLGSAKVYMDLDKLGLSQALAFTIYFAVETNVSTVTPGPLAQHAG